MLHFQRLSTFKKYASFALAILFLLAVACQNQETATTSAPEPIKSSPIAPPTNKTFSTAADAIQQQQPLTTYIKKKMTEKIWHFETAVVIKQPEKSKAFKGKWVKFNPDNTLLSGFYEEEGDVGRWVYDEGNDIITVIEGGERPNYTQWKVKFSSNTDDVIIWVGTTKFQNNNTQIKMLRRREKPTRSEDK